MELPCYCEDFSSFQTIFSPAFHLLLFILPFSFSSEVHFQSHLLLLILFIYLRFCPLILLTFQPLLLHCNITRTHFHYVSYFCCT